MPARWVIQHKIFKAGCHLPKYPKWEPPAAPMSHYGVGGGFTHVHTMYPPAFNGRGIFGGMAAATRKGNLDEEEYRFFLGHPNEKSKYAQCRACLTVFTAKHERRVHGHAGCNLLFGEALKPLIAIGKCLVCEEPTLGHKKWGVPLCAGPKNCSMLWRYDVCRPLPLVNSLMDAEERLDVALLPDRD